MMTAARACLKIHSRHLHAPLRGIFAPNSFNVARYAALIWGKSPTKWDAHLAESNFQTRSSADCIVCEAEAADLNACKGELTAIRIFYNCFNESIM